MSEYQYEIANLIDSVDRLTDAVNIKKTLLDDAVDYVDTVKEDIVEEANKLNEVLETASGLVDHADEVVILANVADSIPPLAVVADDVATVADKISAVVNVSNNIDNIAALDGSVYNRESFRFTAAAGQSVYTLPTRVRVTNNVDVYLNGVRQVPSVSYYVSDNLLVFAFEMDAGDVVEGMIITSVSGSTVRADALLASAEADRATAMANRIDLGDFDEKMDLIADTIEAVDTVKSETLQARDEAVAASKYASTIGQVLPFGGKRTSIYDGCVALDGIVALREDFPDLWNWVESGAWELISEEEWQETPAKRGAFSEGDGTTTFRFPDYNGVQEGSFKGAYLRGDGRPEMKSGDMHGDAIRNITGQSPTLIQYGSNAYTGAYVRNSTLQLNVAATAGNNMGGSTHTFDAANVVPTTDPETGENRGVGVVVTWIMRARGGTVPNLSPTAPATLGANDFIGMQRFSGGFTLGENAVVDTATAMKVVSGAGVQSPTDFTTTDRLQARRNILPPDGTTSHILLGDGTLKSIRSIFVETLTFGDIGSIVFADRTTSAGGGTVVAGSSLRQAGLNYNSVNGSSVQGNWILGGLSGQWRALGHSFNRDAGYAGATLWVRVS